MYRKYCIRYLKKAQNDLIEIFEYIKRDNPSAAQNFINKINKSISILERFPFSGVMPRDIRLRTKEYRIIIIDDYLAFYLVRGRIVRIYRIIHGKRKYSFLLR